MKRSKKRRVILVILVVLILVVILAFCGVEFLCYYVEKTFPPPCFNTADLK